MFQISPPEAAHPRPKHRLPGDASPLNLPEIRRAAARPYDLMTAPTLHTKRLTLRPHVHADYEPLAAFYQTDRAQYVNGPVDPIRVWYGFGMDVGSWDLQGFGAWAITHSDGTLFGQVGLNRPPFFPENELGWILFDGYEGHGYATEAARAARAFAYDTLGWTTAVSYIDPENAASIRVAERLGATLDLEAPKPDPGDLVYRHPAPEART